MQEKLVDIIKTNLGSEFLNQAGLYNIFPDHVPNGAIDNNYSSAVVYNLIQADVVYGMTLYHVQLSVFNLDYAEVRRIAVALKSLFNSKTFAGDTDSFISSTVDGMLEIPFDTETGIYGVAVNCLIKTAREW